MDGNAGESDGGGIRREGFIFDLAEFSAIECIGPIDGQIGRQAFVDAAADFLIRGEGEADRAVRQVRMGQEVAGGGHQDGDTRLVIGPQQRQA